MAFDMLCLEMQNSTCIKDFKMLSVIQTSGLEGLSADGIIGLAPSTQRTKASLFVDELYNAGQISKRIFSFKIMPKESGQQSLFTLGGYNTQYSGGGNSSSITWNELINTNYWSLNLVSVKVGSTNLKLSSHTAIVDTGTSYLLMPQGKFQFS
jgi:Eukaryotic aspartyl protease